MVDVPQLADALLGGGLPSAACYHLCAAGMSYHLDAEAERHLALAQAAAPGHAAVLIAYYRYYFYKGRLPEALHVARLCLAKAAKDNGLCADWRQVAANDAVFGQYDAVLPRFFLFVLKGFAYLQMRLGNLEEGEAAVRKLLELDPADKIGAGVLLGILQRRGEVDDD
jgi:tetratricopeptide (TPR) repeat protein